jgi:hypothetical protein
MSRRTDYSLEVIPATEPWEMLDEAEAKVPAENVIPPVKRPCSLSERNVSSQVSMILRFRLLPIVRKKTDTALRESERATEFDMTA